jgi:hypothetical protein
VNTERLGLDPNGQAPVWVIWIDNEDLLGSLELLAPGFRCPGCGRAIDLARPRGVLACVEDTPNCRSVSDRCAGCQARIHFDNTPADERAALRWPQVAVGAPLRPPTWMSDGMAQRIRDDFERARDRRAGL